MIHILHASIVLDDYWLYISLNTFCLFLNLVKLFQSIIAQCCFIAIQVQALLCTANTEIGK